MEILVLFYFILGPLLMLGLPVLIGSGFEGKRLPLPMLAFVAIVLALALTPVFVGATHMVLLVPWWMGNSSAYPAGVDLLTAIAGCAGLEFVLMWVAMEGIAKPVNKTKPDKKARVRVVVRSGNQTKVLSEPPASDRDDSISDLNDVKTSTINAPALPNERVTAPLEIGSWSLDETSTDAPKPPVQGADDATP